MAIKRTNSFRFASDTGASVAVDLSKMNLNPDQVKVLRKIVKDSGPANLTRVEWESIKKIKAGVGGVPDSVALIVRFDWTWVRIDERLRDFEELKELNIQLQK
jgi:hypothetical protein